MNKKMKSELKNYLSKIRKSLPCSFNAKQAFIFMLKSQIKSYLEENPDATFEDVINNFGEPSTIAESFDTEECKIKIRSQKLKILILELFSVILLVLSIFLLVLFIDSLDRGSITVTGDSFTVEST